jgi:nucleoside-diphosphate-sugar epimerase
VRVFVAGATGSIGRRLVAQLIERGHDVVGSFRSSPETAQRLSAAGAEIIQLDLLDAAAVHRAVAAARPDAIVHEATALSAGGFFRRLDRTFAQTNQLRTTGTDALIAAAKMTGVTRLVAQSFAPYRYARQGGMVKAEEDPLDANPPKGTHATAVVEHAGPAVYNIVDDEPAATREWLPVLADALGAKPPRHVPAWIVRLLVGEDAVMGATQSRGASNATAKRELGWTLRYPSWRVGFPAAHSQASPETSLRGQPGPRKRTVVGTEQYRAPTDEHTKKGD